MGIEKFTTTYYVVECDINTDECFGCWGSEERFAYAEGVETDAMCYGWVEIDGKWICPAQHAAIVRKY